MFSNLNNLKKNKIEFTIKDIDLSIVNAIRRIIISEIPNVAIYFDNYNIDYNDIKINKNTGKFHNEYISHRISLIPIMLTENQINNGYYEDLKLILKKKNKTQNVINITTKDFEIKKGGKLLSETEKEKILPKDDITKDYILITKLKPNIYNTEEGEELDIECSLSLDIAKTHAAWNPVSQCTFYNVVNEKEAKSILDEKLKKITSKEEKDDIKSQFDTLEKAKYYRKNKHGEANEFNFKIESECLLRPEYLIFKALKIIKEKLNNLGNNIQVKNIGNLSHFFEVEVLKESHTLLNILQSLIYNNNIREKETDLKYIGYYQPHPLDDTMVLKLSFEENNKLTPSYVHKFILDQTKIINEKITSYIKDWIKFSKLNNMGIEEVKKFK